MLAILGDCLIIFLVHEMFHRTFSFPLLIWLYMSIMPYNTYTEILKFLMSFACPKMIIKYIHFLKISTIIFRHWIQFSINLAHNWTSPPTTKQKHSNKPQTTALSFCVCMFDNNSFLDQDSSLKFYESWTVDVWPEMRPLRPTCLLCKCSEEWPWIFLLSCF